MTQKNIQPHNLRNTGDEHSDALPWTTALFLFWPIAIAGAGLDLWSKWAIFKWLEQTPSQQFSLIEGFAQFILRENDGAAFSMFRGWTFFLIGTSIAALLVVVGLFFLRKIHSKLLLFALGCMAAGIIGNLYDRVFNAGRVRDFIDVYVGSYHWPTFNVADSLLCIGVGLMIIVNLKATTSERHGPEQKEER
jgi:signal peptidase II